MAQTRMLQRDELKLKLKEIMKRFKYQDLMDQAESVFALTSKTAKSMMSKYKLPHSKESLIDFILYHIRDFEVQDLQQRLVQLSLLANAYYSHRRTWVVLQLVNAMKENVHPVSDCHKIKRNIEQQFHIQKQNAYVYIVEHEGLYWCAVARKILTRKHGTKMQSANFFVFDLALPYILTVNRPFPKRYLLKIIANSLNYDNTKRCHLDGKDILSLFSLIKTRERVGVAHEPVDYNPAAAEIGKRHLDFTQNKARKQYADQCFDKHSVVLQTFTVEAETEWRGVTILPELEGNDLSTTMKMRSENVSDMIKHMVEIGMMKVPLPSYVEDLPYRARNHMVLKPRKQKDQ